MGQILTPPAKMLRLIRVPIELGSSTLDSPQLRQRVRLLNILCWTLILFYTALIAIYVIRSDWGQLQNAIIRMSAASLVLWLNARRRHGWAAGTLIVTTYISVVVWSLGAEFETVGPFSLIVIALGAAYLVESPVIALGAAAWILATMVALRFTQMERFTHHPSRIYPMSLALVAFFLWLLLFFQRREYISYTLTIRRQLERLDQQKRALEDANALKLKMFSVVAHDLRGPMTSLLLILENMERSLVSGESGAAIVRSVIEEQRGIHFMIENILEWARTQIQDMNSDPQLLPLHWLVDDELSLLRPHAHPKEVELRSTVDDSLRIFADPNMVRFVLRNLVLNAVKFSYRGQAVDVAAEVDHSFIVLRVTDHGTGMLPETASRIFKMGGTSLTGTESEVGTGLGLILCREFIEKNGGNIGFSTTLGTGTTFEVRLPAAPITK